MLAQMQISTSAYETLNSAPAPWATTWEHFCAAILGELKRESPSREQMRCIAPHRLAPMPDGTLRRLKERVAGMSGIVLDLDEGLTTEGLGRLLADLAAARVASLVYTSPNDSRDVPNARRARVWAHVSRECAPHEARALKAVLAEALGVTDDPTTYDASRLYFVGRLAGTPEREAWVIEGEPLDVDSLLRLAPVAPPIIVESSLDADDEVQSDHALVDPLLDQIAPILAPLNGGRQRWFLPCAGWLKANGYTTADLYRLLDRLEASGWSKVEKYRDQAKRARPPKPGEPSGPGPIREVLGAHFAALDASVNAHPRSAELRAKRAAPAVEIVSSALALQGAPTNEMGGEPAPAVEGAERRADLGNARRLVRMFGRDLRYFKAWRSWFVWDGRRWALDETGHVDRCAKAAAESLWEDAKNEPDEEKRKAAFAWAAKCQDRARITNMIALAETEPGIPVAAQDLDANPWLLNTQNGVLDLRAGKLYAPTREMLMTKVTAAPYAEGARSELWEQVIHRTTGGNTELAAYVQRALGYALFGAHREKAFWFGYGPPDGAKSTVLGAVGDVLGDYHASADASTWLVQTSTGGNRGDIARLRGARLVTTFEVRSKAKFDQALIKRITGGDVITAAGKYKDEIEFKPSFALWLGANDRPAIPDDDEGLWSRLQCVPFTSVIPKAEQDKALREKLASPEHAPGVLAWLVRGCLEWQRAGLGHCAAVETANQGYRDAMNPAAGFVDDACELTHNPSDSTDAGQLRALYEQWCTRTRAQPLKTKAWGSRLRALGVTGGDDASRANGRRMWHGIRLRAPGE